jgi:hypothetical protein
MEVLGPDLVLCIAGPFNFFVKPARFWSLVLELQVDPMTSVPFPSDGDEDMILDQVL